MNIAFTVSGNDPDAVLDPRFGRAAGLLITDENFADHRYVDTSDIAQGAHGAGPRMAQVIADDHVNVVITGNGPGGNAMTILKKLNVVIYAGAGQFTAREAFAQYKAGNLREFAS